ncbi:uncharacterized protein [Apostichopus japonicus]|uniref:uncharacterized protein n=1 Tax=Stichopus japonicus TaxID=307972 RepID=UPI003AB36B6E
MVTVVNNMASGHAMSVVTNSCVRLPRNPRTKLAATFDERTFPDGDLTTNTGKSWEWRDTDESRDSPDTYAQHETGKFQPNVIPSSYTNHSSKALHNRNVDGSNRWDEYEADLLASLEDDNENLSSHEFFNKLQNARISHRDNLRLLEEAYNEKLGLRLATDGVFTKSRQSVDNGFQYSERMVSGSRIQAGPVFEGDHSLHHINDELEKFEKSQPAWSALPSKTSLPNDNVRDMSSRKPPTGRSNPRQAWQKSSSTFTNSTRGSAAFNNDWSDVTWTSDSDAEVVNSQFHKGSQKTRKLSESSTLSLSKQPDSPAVILDNMWDNFSVDGYAPRSRTESRASSRSHTRTAKKTEWSPKITIPKPFQMTVRDAEKEKKMTRASVEIDMDIKRKAMEEEVECQKQFKATPVPATTFIPLYDDLKERQTERSREIQLQSKQRLKESQKPFSFVKREEQKKSLKSKIQTPPPKQSLTPKFKARKVPKSVFDPSVDERILEEEEYRKIRIKMRAEEMLRSSALPPNMEGSARQYTDGKQRRKLMKKREKHAFLTDEHKFHPHVNGEIPDYDRLYHKFQEEARQKKQEKEPTVVEPFNLRTSRIPSKRDKILAELEAEENARKEEFRGLSMKSLRSSRSLRSSMEDVLPIKTTSSSVLRKSLTDRTMFEKVERDKQDEERDKQKKLRQRKLQTAIVKRARAHDNSQSLESTSKEKLKQFRDAEISRQKEYERELQEMMERIESRPLLFERESQHNAQKRAERQYIEALRSAGLDEGFLERKSRQAKGGGAAQEDRPLRNDSESDEDLDILQRTSEVNDTYEVDQMSNGTFSSEEDNSSVA